MTTDKFWAKVDRNGPVGHLGTACWVWIAATFPKTGYGAFRVGNKTLYAHRVAWEERFGTIPSGQKIDHRCHTKNCVRFDHLRPSTHKQNMENRSGLNSNNKSGVRGVFWDSRSQRWRAEIVHCGKTAYSALFRSKDDAAAAVLAKRIELFTHNDLDRLEGVLSHDSLDHPP